MCYRNHYMRNKGWHHGWHGHPKQRHWKQKFHSRWNYPPVNIQESEDRFELYVYASGFSKEEIHVKVSNNYLLITGQKVDENLNQNWKRQELAHDRFERRFELSEKVDQEGISAKFEDGVLNITLKKLPGFETIEQDINIA